MIRTFYNKAAHQILLLCVLFFVAMPALAQAEQITAFESDIQLQTDSSFIVTETIWYDFGALRRHGIFRDIAHKHPQTARGWLKERYIDIEVLSVTKDDAVEPYTVTHVGSNTKVKIGDPDRTITGAHTYTIVYRVIGGLSYFDDGTAEIYWNVTGNEWPVQIRQVYAQVGGWSGDMLPQRACYKGPEGSTAPCDKAYERDGIALFTASDLSAGSGLTIAQELQGDQFPVVELERYNPVFSVFAVVTILVLLIVFVKPLRVFLTYVLAVVPALMIFFILATTLPDLFPKQLSFEYRWWYIPVVVFVLLYAWALYWWYNRSRTVGPIIAQYEPYEGVKPMYAGLLIDRQLHSRDITAGMIRLAQEGVIKIQKIEHKTIIGFSVDDYTVSLLKDPAGVVSHFQRQLLELLFAGQRDVADARKHMFFNTFMVGVSGMRQALVAADIGKTVSLRDIKNNTAKLRLNARVIQKLRAALYADLKEQGFVKISPLWSGSVRQVITAGVVFTILGIATGAFIGEGVFFVMVFLLIPFMFNVRTQKGFAARDHLKGFKEFLSVTDAERFKFHNAPSKSPEQFLAYLPYAVAFGVEEEWAEVFKDITIPVPDWYEGDSIRAFAATDLTKSLGAFSSSLSRASVSSSGGSSGGGSSGGGGGGGGGGSW